MPKSDRIRDAVNQWYLNAVQTESIDKDKVTLIKSAFLQAWNHELEPDDPQLYNKKASEIAIRKRRPWATAAYTLMIYTKRAIWNALTPRLYEDDPKIIAKLQKNPTPMGKVVSKAIGEFLHVAKVRRSHQEREWDSTWPTIFKASGQMKKIAIPVVRYNKLGVPAHPPVPQAQDAGVSEKTSKKESAKQQDDDEE